MEQQPWIVREARGDMDRLNVTDKHFGTKREALTHISRQPVATVQRMGRIYSIRIAK